MEGHIEVNNVEVNQHQLTNHDNEVDCFFVGSVIREEYNDKDDEDLFFLSFIGTVTNEQNCDKTWTETLNVAGHPITFFNWIQVHRQTKSPQSCLLPST